MEKIEELMSALREAERLIEAGGLHERDDESTAYNRQTETEEELPILVWAMMRAITCGIGMKSKWDRERQNDESCRGQTTKQARVAEWRQLADEALNTLRVTREKYGIEKLRVALKDATELLGEIMRDEVNHQDEAEKWLRAYGEICPSSCSPIVVPPELGNYFDNAYYALIDARDIMDGAGLCLDDLEATLADLYETRTHLRREDPAANATAHLRATMESP